MVKGIQRFSSRVENYIQYRPRYPQGIIESLRSHCQLLEASIIADIGSGTGILAEMFLRQGNLVYAVEPNQPMREAAEKLLEHYPGFRSIDGTAEETTLPGESFDFVTAGQAFHWFDPEKARKEFQRILKPEGWVVLVWNERRAAEYPFGNDYEELLEKYTKDYAKVTHKEVDEGALQEFFGNDFKHEAYPNSQSFDFEGLKGRLLSSSYSPEAGELGHEIILSELKKIFDAYQINGRVDFQYDTNLYYGRLA
jgi:SAM-dependent methyltransferase